MVLKFRQAQGVGHDIELVFVQLQQILRQNQGIGNGIVIGKPHFQAGCPQKAGVKIGVVGHQHPVPHKRQKFRQHLFHGRCAHQHGIGNAGQLHDFRLQWPPGGDKALEPVNLLPAPHEDGTDFDNGIGFGGKTGGFQIEGHKLPGKGKILTAMNHDTVVYIIDIVALAAVDDLKGFAGTGDFGLGGGFHGIGEGLGTAVIRDGKGTVPPGCSLPDSRCHIGQGIHIAHGGVQVQLHPFFTGCGILSGRQGAGLHGIGAQNGLVIVLVHVHFALNFQNGSGLDVFQHALGLVGLHETIDPDRAGMVGHVKIDNPCVALFQLLVVNGENLPLHNDTAHIKRQLPHGNRDSAYGFSVESGAFLFGRSAAGCAGGGGYGGRLLQNRVAQPIHGFEKGGAFQRCAGGDGDLNLRLKPLSQAAADGGNGITHGLHPICRQMDGKVLTLPAPAGTGQCASIHGIFRHEKIQQLCRFNAVQLLRRMDGDDSHGFQLIQLT